MDTISSQALYAIDPKAERFTRWLAETTRWAVRTYWELFVTLPVTFILVVTALLCLIVGVLDLIKHPVNAYADLLLIGAAAAFLVFQRLRAFLWAFLACCIFWIPLMVALIFSIAGKDYKAVSAAANIAIIVIYFLPPLVASVFIDYARHRKP